MYVYVRTVFGCGSCYEYDLPFDEHEQTGLCENSIANLLLGLLY